MSPYYGEHVSPERLYLETKWGSLISFELAALVDVEETVDFRLADRLRFLQQSHEHTRPNNRSGISSVYDW
jgi:hypothetical protein